MNAEKKTPVEKILEDLPTGKAAVERRRQRIQERIREELKQKENRDALAASAKPSPSQFPPYTPPHIPSKIKEPINSVLINILTFFAFVSSFFLAYPILKAILPMPHTFRLVLAVPVAVLVTLLVRVALKSVPGE